jgi:hypothetical protein
MKRALGVALLLALGLHAYTKGWELLPEMLWVCHVASAVLAVGLLVPLRRWVEAGLLLHIAVGAPSFLLDVAFGYKAPPTSWLVHVLPWVAGYVGLRQEGLRPRTWVYAWGLFLATFAVSLLTPPRLNVNLVHAAWGPLKQVLPSPWAVRGLNAGGALVCLFGVEWLLRKVWKPHDRLGA